MTTEQQKKSIDLLRLVLREGTTNKTTEILIEEFLIKILKSEQPKPVQISYKGMTKKEFRDKCDFHVYTGGYRKVNAIYFDWQSGTTEDGQRYNGNKFMVNADTKTMTKTELFNEFWKWVTEQIQQPSYLVAYRYAVTDMNRFKVPLSI